MRVKTDKAIVKVICESFIITFKNLLKYMIFDFSRFQLVYEYFYIRAQTKIIIKLISNTNHTNKDKS